ncbi:M16 family metallopeptidase [Sphingomicrobium flavum]|uniref:M16 family metallopeptidase n=1 Tax=Sphingomicrobium flavum TaxID=1229164 RepID=UPI0021AD96B1|nr:insulinase family protein [Sphingomicrobium flavum]
MRTSSIVRGSRLSVSALALALALPMAAPALAQAQDAATPATPATGIEAWQIESSDLSPDGSVVFGRLPNGMRYALQRNGNPAGEAVIRFNVQVGNRDEEDAERGAAHFIEHMAFNGTTNIPEGELLPMLERLGLAFGADTNAETSLDYTTYKLDLPNTDEQTIDSALMVIREMAGEMTIDPAAVERERGIIMSEAQVRNEAGRRRLADYFGVALPGSRLGDRINADVERIANISAEELRAFYEGYYRPERATLVVVGDFDPAEMQQKIEAKFSDWQGTGEARAVYSLNMAEGDGPQVANFVDPAIPGLVELHRITPWTPAINSVAAQREELLRAIAGLALGNRINALSRTAQSPMLGGQVSEQPLARTARSYGLLIVAKDGQWRETITLAEQELRRANDYGFAPGEIAEAKAVIETALTNAVSQASGRRSAALADALIGASMNDSVATAPDFNLALWRAIEPSITAEAVSEAFRAAWQPGPSVVHVSTKEPIEGGKAAILAALEESAAVAVAAPEAEKDVEFAYGDWGTPGQVVADERIEDLGIRTVRFANGLQLNMKTTDFEPGKVSYSMLVGRGLSAFPADKPGLSNMLETIIGADGLKAHDADELRRVLAGRSVGVGLGASSDALTASGATTPDDLRLQLDLLAARLTATAWREDTQAQWAGVAPLIAQNGRAVPIQVYINGFNAALAGGDARFGMTDLKALEAISLDDLRAVVAPQLAEGALALGLVGDLDEDAAIAAVAATLGALPARPVRSDAPGQGAAPTFAKAGETIRLFHDGQADQGVVSLSWASDDGADLRDDIVRNLLAATMGLRLTETLREELGATYSPEALSYSQLTYDGFGHITAIATVGPEAMDQVAEVIQTIAADMAQTPVSDDLLERARSPIREGYERAERQNGQWLGIVTKAQSHADILERRRTRKALLEAVTSADIQAAAQRYLAGSAPVQIRVVPQGQ